MIDLHTHSIFSDGELLPSELVRRAVVHGYTAIAITDHVDFTNIGHVLDGIKKAAYLEEVWDIQVLPGVEITHVPPQKIAEMVSLARKLGARIVVVHGETLAEPVIPGTNRAAIEAGADILAHPGLISRDDAVLAAEQGVCLEITSRCGHNRANGHVARVAEEVGAALVVGTDSHSPGDLLTDEQVRKVALGAGLSEKRVNDALISQPLNLINAHK
ncbi:MAG: histidinol phosphate phosphatase domain-containing protein [Methanosarcinales archaeon]|nr:histidinol phosphate phosphatase domain-containing protein [ANME-2 cluster archaeon]MDF1531066.1 histidinol phosphate phosphatase domain-containing protein [ANME-2 cluster archaeon]MDW7775521.1 histidinol phosphate phosphatase domain-containing protein [Methanosarcinales archaeon]